MMGVFFGPQTGSRSYSYTAELAEKLERKGGRSSTGATRLLSFMQSASDHRTLCPEEAEQAAKSLRDTARRLHGTDRRIAEQIAADAQEAADAGRSWTVG